jgi:hypothetical protein
MARRSVLALVFVLSMAGCAVVPSATLPTAQQRQAAATDCPEDLASVAVRLTFVNRLHQAVALSIASSARQCPTTKASVPPGESRDVTLAVVPGVVQRRPIDVSIDGEVVTSVPYGVQITDGSARQFVADPNTGQLGCSRVNTWAFVIAAAAAQARLSCAGALEVSLEYRI